MNRILLGIGAVILGLVILCGLYIFAKGVRNVQLASASTNWPTTPGKVFSSQTTRDVTESMKSGRTSVTFNTRTVIQYEVNGQPFSTDVLQFGQTLGSGDRSESILKALRYPEGTEVPVSYNPDNPSVAVMKPGIHADAFWLPAAGLAFLLPAIMCLIMGPTMMRTISGQPDQEFANSVHASIVARRLGETLPVPQPRGAGGSMALASVAVLFGAIFIGLGILALTAGLQRMWHGQASQSWPTAKGTVIVATEGDSDDTTARIVYQYEVAGIKHLNNLRTFAQVDSAGSSPYQPGAAVKVSYFPTDPDVAVLQPGNSSDALILPGIGIAVLLFGLAVFIWIVPNLAK